MNLGLGIGIPFQRKRGGAAPFVGLLDEVPGAAFAASMRLLRNGYSGGLARVIAYDGATQQGAADIMPYKIGNEYWIDLNSSLENLDATATGRGLTTSDTLADLCSVGVDDYDGLVTNLYDQGLSPNHAAQTNISTMPKLVDAGGLVTENGKPALDFSGSKNMFLAPLGVISDITTYTVVKMTSTGSLTAIYSFDNGTYGAWANIIVGRTFSNQHQIFQRTTGNTFLSGNEAENLMQLLRVDSFSANDFLKIRQNTNENQLTHSQGAFNADTHATLGFSPANTNYLTNFKMQSLISYFDAFNSDVESNINNAFSIY